MNVTTIFRFGISVGVAVAIGACSLQRTAEHMVQTSDDIKSDSEHLGKRTDDLSHGMVVNDSAATQTDRLDALYGIGKYTPPLGVSLSFSEPDLFAAAEVSVRAMMFQYWHGDYDDTVGTLDNYFYDSMKLLFGRTTIHIPRSFDVDARSSATAAIFGLGRDYTAVGALAANLDMMDPNYAAALTRVGLSQWSAYDVMVQALRDRLHPERPELLPRTVALVQQWTQDAIYILQLRHGAFPLMVIARMTTFQDESSPDRAWGVLESQISSAKKVDLAPFVPAELMEWTNWLNKALATRQALREMGIQPQYNSVIQKVLNSYDFGQTALLQDKTRVQPGSIMDLRRKFAAAYTAILAQ